MKWIDEDSVWFEIHDFNPKRRPHCIVDWLIVVFAILLPHIIIFFSCSGFYFNWVTITWSVVVALAFFLQEIICRMKEKNNK